MTIHENYDLTPLTTFGIPVRARYFATYSSLRELQQIMRTPEYQRSEVLHIGGGSNLLFLRDFDGIVLKSEIRGITIYRKNEETVYVIAGAGEVWDDLVRRTVLEGLTGLENLAGIPGSVGASAVQNVGAYGVEAGDYIFKVECYDRLTHHVLEIKPEACRFGYRDSMFKHEGRGRYFVLRVCFRLCPSQVAEHTDYGILRTLKQRLAHAPSPREVMQEVLDVRNSKLPDPKEIGSAGSFFKNPVLPLAYYKEQVLRRDPSVPYYDLPDGRVKIPAGWLIEHAGLKGCTIGGAQVYPKQCLVIVNKDGHATGRSVAALAEHVRRTVHEKYSIVLRPEVNYIDTSVQVRILGSGTSKGVPEPGCTCSTCTSSDPRDKRLRASVLVRTHGLTLLIDASPDFRRQALDANLDYLDGALITHQHYDHVGGIDDLRSYCRDGSMPMYMLPRVADDLRRRLDYCFREHPYPGIPRLDIHEVSDEPFYFRGLKIIPIHVKHASLPILGYRIGPFAYVTDAKTIEDEEIEKLRGVKLLIVNALREREHFSHFNITEALDFIRKVEPEQAYLTHICHDMAPHAQASQLLPPNVHLAYDGLTLTVN